MKKNILLFSAICLLTLSTNAQSFQWAQREGDQTTARHIATDDAGNSYVFGRLFITTTVGGQTLNLGNGDYFLAKYDNTGSSLWVKQLDSLEVSDMACNATGVYLTGRYGTGASFNGTAIMNSGSGWDGFIANIDGAGNLNWVVTANNPGTYESANSVSLDNSGNLYIAGTFSGSTVTIGSATLTGPAVESMFLLKMAHDGNIIWSKKATANVGGSVSGNRVEVAPSGDLYVMANAGGDTAHFDSLSFFAGGYDAELLLHYNNSGAIQNMITINQISQDNVVAMIVDGSGNVYTLQTNYLTSFDIAKFSPMLDTTWIITDGTGGHLSVRDIEVTQAGQIIVAGDVGDDATFGGTLTVHDNGGANGFLAYYSSAGNFLSLEEIPGSVFMGPTGMDAAENIYMIGNVSDSASFDAIDLTTSGVEAMFLAKYGQSSTEITSLKGNNTSIYPNPCSHVLNCNLKTFAGSINVELYNVCGAKIYETKTEQDLLQIDLFDYENGIYLLSISNNESLITQKIVLRK